MSIRLNKIGNIPEATPYTSTSSIAFGRRPQAWHPSSGEVYPYKSGDMIGRNFRAYKNGQIGPSGSTISYSGGGYHVLGEGVRFPTTTEYFLAGFDITSLFDEERDAAALIGISSQFGAVTLASAFLPEIVPMFIWADKGDADVKVIRSLSIVPPTHVARFTAGVTNSVIVVDREVEVSQFFNGERKDIYFAWFAGRPFPTSEATVDLKHITCTVQAASLKGNRPVFDPVMV